MHWLGWVGIVLAIGLLIGSIFTAVSGGGGTHRSQVAAISASASAAESSAAAAASSEQAAQDASLASEQAAQDASDAASLASSEAAASAASAAAAAPKAIPGTIYITQDEVDAGTIAVSDFRFGQGPLSEYGEAPTKGYYVAFTVRADSLINGLSISPTDFYVVEAGRHYDYASAGYELDNSLEFTTINKGEHAQGTIVFDVPSPHGTLQYSPNYNGAPIGAWRY